MSVLMPVQFVKSQTVENRGYNANETAAFDEETAAFLITCGVARRVPKATHPLVQAALTNLDPEIQQLATALQEMAPRLQEFEERASSLRDELTRAKAREAKALALHQPYDPKMTSNIQSRLDVLERQIAILLEHEGPLFEELRSKIVAGLEQQAQEILRDKIAFKLAALVNLVQKARPLFLEMQPAVAALETLRTTASVAGLDAGVLDGLITATMRDVCGDALTGVTGASKIPMDLPTILYALASRP